MKKLFFSLALVASISLASCSSSTSAEKAADQQATEIVAQVDTISTESGAKALVEKVQTTVDDLVKAGKVQEAKDYLDKVAPAIQNKFPSLAPMLDTVKSTVSAAESASVTADSVKNAASDAVDAAKQSAADAVNDAKDKANDAINDAKDKANDAVNDAKNKVNDAANDAKDKANDAVNNAKNAVKDLPGKLSK